MNENYVTTNRRIALAFVVGACVGATIITIQYLFGLYEVNGAEHFKKYWISKGASIFVWAFCFWLIGLLIFGSPAWAILHTKQKRRFYHALLAGFLCPFIFWLAISTGMFTGHKSGNFSAFSNGGKTWIDGQITFHGFKVALTTSFQMGIIGMLVGIAIWRTAYRYKKAN